jgi:hypothetical protein
MQSFLALLLLAALACRPGSAQDLALKGVLDQVGVNNEVLACVSNSALITPDGSYGALKLWLDAVQRAGVRNYLVIAIDNMVCL